MIPDQIWAEVHARIAYAKGSISSVRQELITLARLADFPIDAALSIIACAIDECERIERNQSAEDMLRHVHCVFEHLATLRLLMENVVCPSVNQN